MAKVDQIFNPRQGLNLDIAPDQLDPAVISAGNNFVPTTGGISKSFALGDSQITPTIDASHMLHFQDAAYNSNWVFLDLTGAEIFRGLVASDISPLVAFTATAETPWSSVNFEGAIVVNNSNDVLHFLGQTQLEPSTPANTFRFRRLGKFKNFLIGYGVSQSGGDFQDSRVVWSSPADPGALPLDWDIASPASLSGSSIISSGGVILDGLELGDINVIYKSDSIWTQRFIGGQFLFKFEKRFASTGILAPNCVAAFEDQHFVITQNDIIVHNVYNQQSVATDIVKEYFFNNLSATRWEQTRVIVNDTNQEIYILFPTKNSDPLSVATFVPNDVCLIWRWEYNSWGIKDISSLNIITAGLGSIVETAASDWGTAQGPWERDGVWRNDPNIVYAQEAFFLRGIGNPLAQISTTGLEFGNSLTTTIERLAIPFGVDRKGNRYQEYLHYKDLMNVWVYADTTAPFNIQFATQEDIDSAIIWTSPIEFDVSLQRKLSVFLSGVLLGVRIITTASRFTLRKIEYEYQMQGEF